MNEPPPSSRPGWMQRLGQRWGVGPTRVILILVVFTCTGFTVMFLKRPVVALFTEGGEQPFWFSILYYLLILPVYNVLLLVYGTLFGQFRFFWNFEKRFLSRIFRRRKPAGQ
ncbi:MAG TPA: diacylglyceryl transferase [Flavobacteriales bacterium]|nr:diacylglyceryl transferase [Flavobacteriales bacterium]HRQ84938.1 diacylglyceryl transferase [Flavobacteriales bacterium]